MLFFLHFTNMETEAHRGQVMYSKSHSHHEKELDRMSQSSSRAIFSILYFIYIHAYILMWKVEWMETEVTTVALLEALSSLTCPLGHTESWQESSDSMLRLSHRAAPSCCSCVCVLGKGGDGRWAERGGSQNTDQNLGLRLHKGSWHLLNSRRAKSLDSSLCPAAWELRPTPGRRLEREPLLPSIVSTGTPSVLLQ